MGSVLLWLCVRAAFKLVMLYLHRGNYAQCGFLFGIRDNEKSLLLILSRRCPQQQNRICNCSIEGLLLLVCKKYTSGKNQTSRTQQKQLENTSVSASPPSVPVVVFATGWGYVDRLHWMVKWPSSRVQPYDSSRMSERWIVFTFLLSYINKTGR